jgi:hypothetical protein
MKKGFFISLTAMLVLVLIVAFLEINRANQAEQNRLESDYMKNKISADYARDVSLIYMPTILSKSGKYALAEVSSNHPVAVMEDEIEDLMRSGSASFPAHLTIPTLTADTLRTVKTGVTLGMLSFDVLAVGQPDPWTISLLTEVNITLSSGEINWSDSRNHTTLFDLNGLEDTTNGLPIQIEFYSENAAYPCYLRTVWPTYDCLGVSGISG